MTPSSPAVVKTSPWHTPVPYFFIGLSVVLGLIAFSLLILACTYFNVADDDGAGERDLEAGDAKSDDHKKGPTVFEEKYVVIMAGEAKPTFLATPITSGGYKAGSCGCRSNLSEKLSDVGEGERGERRSGTSEEHGEPVDLNQLQ